MTDLNFTLHDKNGPAAITLPISHVVIAGWTGRDPVARDKHIAELEEIGVPRPASTPIYYRVSSNRLTTATQMEASGTESSGEVEFVLLGGAGRMFVGVGSDHTDRKVETYNITVSKQMCDKPMAPELWDYADVAGHWDDIKLRSFAIIDGARHLYQEGVVASMLAAPDLVAREFGAGGLPEGCAMFGGTFAVLGGIRAASRFEYEMEDPVLGRTIRYAYDVTTLPILG